MRLLKRKGYVLKSETIDSSNIKKVYPKSSRVKTILAASLVVLFSTAGLISTATIPAQADDYASSGCPLDIGKNSWAEALGGLNSRQFDYAVSTKDIPANPYDSSISNDEATIRDRWVDRIGFTAWYPAISGNSEDRNILTVVPPQYTTAGKAGVSEGLVYSSNWLQFIKEHRDAASANKLSTDFTTKVSKDALIRKGETHSVDIWPVSDLDCKMHVFFGDALNVNTANFMLTIGNGINKIATGLYVDANSGSNITQAIGLSTTSSGTVSGLFTTDPQYTSWTYSLGQTIEKALKGDPGKNNGLYDALFLNFLLPVVFIGAIVVLINGIRRRAIELITGIVWMLVVMTAGTLFLTSPMLIPKTIDAVVTTVTSGINTAVIGSGSEANIGCEPSKELILVDSVRNAKMVECEIWYNTIMKPWAQGQFGLTYGNPTDEAILNGTGTYDPNNVLSNTIHVAGQKLSYSQIGGWAAYQLENMSSPAGSNVEITMSQINVPNMFSKADYFTNGFMSMFISLTIALFISANAFLILAYQIIMLLLLLTSPLFFVIGVIPSKTGKGIVLRWVELVLGLAVKRLIVSVLMAVFIKMFIIVANDSSVGIFYQIIIFGVLAYVGITQRSKILQMFTANINFGGDKSIKLGGKIEAVGERAPMATGAAVGAGAGWVAARGAARAKVGIAQASNNKFERKLMGKTEEERRALLDKKQEKVEKKTLRKTMLNGGSISDAKSRMLDRTRHIEQEREIKQNFENQRESQEALLNTNQEASENLAQLREKMDPDFKAKREEERLQAALDEQAKEKAVEDFRQSQAEAKEKLEEAKPPLQIDNPFKRQKKEKGKDE